MPWPTGRTLLDDIASAQAPRGALSLWHIGQSGFFVKGGGLTLLFDPYLKATSQRTFPPPVSPDSIEDVDYVLCTHAHSDHLDTFAVERIARAAPHARFVVPAATLDQVTSLGIERERVIAPDVDSQVQLDAPAGRGGAGASGGEAPTMTLLTVPAAHGDAHEPVAEYDWEPHPEHGYRFVGYVVTLNGVTLYHAGDTTIYPGMVERLRPLGIDLALLPINGRDWFRERRGIIGNMDHREAADLGHAIGAGTIVPMHFDMFAGNPGFPGWFVDYCVATYPGQDFHVPVRARRWIFHK